MPETGALIGTPASIRASVEPHTEPIDEEPFDSSVSETRRIVYGNSSTDGIDGLERPLGERAVADVPPLRAAHEARLPDRVGREVVVVDVPALLLAGEVVDLLPLLHRPERQQRQDLRLAAREERGAVRARAHGDLALDVPDLLLGATVRAALVDRDLLADEVLVDRLGRPLHELLRDRVLDRRLALRGRRADRERAARAPRGCGRRGGRASRSGAPSSPARRPSARAGRRGTAREPVPRPRPGAPSRGSPRSSPAPAPGGPCRPRSRPSRSPATRPRRARRRPCAASRSPCSAIAARTASPCSASSSAVSSMSTHFGLPTCSRRSSSASQILRISACASSSASRIVSSGTSSPPASTIVSASLVPTTMRSSVDSSSSSSDGLTTSSPSMRADADGPDRAQERQRRDHQRRGRAVDAEDVVRRHEVGREDGADDLHLVSEALRPERPDRAGRSCGR